MEIDVKMIRDEKYWKSLQQQQLHDSNEYIGRFVMMEAVQQVGEDPDRYDIKGTFEIMPGLT